MFVIIAFSSVCPFSHIPSLCPSSPKGKPGLEDPVLLGRAYGLLARLAPLLPAARQRCEAVAPAVADGMERFVKHGTVLAGGVSLLAEIPEGPVLNGACVHPCVCGRAV